MPELPDIVVYLEALRVRVQGERLERVRLASPFLLRSVEPPLGQAEGRRVAGLRRIGKRIAVELEGQLFLVIHLMIAGRLHWRKPGAAIPKRGGLAAFDFGGGTLLLTEASPKKRAALHVIDGENGLAAFERGGVEPLEVDLDAFRAGVTKESHTLKRTLTDPRLVSGVGNAYSDEILHRARLSPFKLSGALSAEELERLYESTRATLHEWIERLRTEAGGEFPRRVTAFRDEMAVHGRYGKPCPACSTTVQRIVYAENECNYCPTCQTGGRLLADRALSRLLKSDWPRTVADLEERSGA